MHIIKASTYRKNLWNYLVVDIMVTETYNGLNADEMIKELRQKEQGM